MIIPYLSILIFGMQLAGTGIDGISVISAIFGQEDPGAATKKLVELTREMLSK